MKLTPEHLKDTTAKIEKITNQLTDTYMRAYSADLIAMFEKKKLSLWIAGLATGLELFVLNHFNLSELNGLSGFFFYFANCVFLFHSLWIVMVYKLWTNLNNLYLEIQKSYDFQRLNVLNSLTLENDLSFDVKADFESNEFTSKLTKLDYFGKKKLLNNFILKFAKWSLFKSDSGAFVLLIFQLIPSIIFYLLV